MAHLQDRYDVVTGLKENTFEFVSEGPKGKIKKRVEIQFLPYAPQFYNLALGDVDKNDEIDDKVVSNNGDAPKVLSTVAVCVVLFFKRNPNAMIIAEGSTNARTRLYQMGISAHLPMIDSLYEVQGYCDGWQPFRKDKNYQAFLIKRKSL